MLRRRSLAHRASIPTLVAALVLASALLVGCGEDHGPNSTRAVPETVIVSSLVFQRADSTVVTMGTTPLVCCGLYDPGFVNERAMRIVLYDANSQLSGWQILILTDRAQPGATTTLPTAVVPPSKVPVVSMFATSIGGEWSSDAGGSAGAIVVHSFRCTSTAIDLDFTVDAVLGSELAGAPPIRVQGSFQATFPARSCQ